jgi:hypothetical protein
MQTLYPDAEWRPLPEAFVQAPITPVLVIFHTIVGSAAGAMKTMARADWPGESHFVNPYNGRMVQLMPLDRRADCNWQVNAWVTKRDLVLANGAVVRKGNVCGAISIESEDDGSPEDTPWTAEQCESFAQFTAWAHVEHGIPVDVPADPFSPGVGYHSLPGLNRLKIWEPNAVPPYGTFIDSSGRTVNVYNPWTNTVGKSCPGPARIAQFAGILERARQLVQPPEPPSEEDDMAIRLVSQTKGEWIWTPGTKPQPFKTAGDRDAIVAAGNYQAASVTDLQLTALFADERPA